MKNYVTLLIFIITLSACRNEKKTKVEVAKKEVNKIDSLTYSCDSVIVYSKNVINDENNDSDTTKAIITYPIFKDEQLNTLIRRRVTDYMSDGAPNITYKDMATSFVSGYDDYFAADKETKETWSLMIDISVLNQTSNYIGLEYVDSDYSGGAHPNTNSYFINYNPQTKLPITFDSLIDASNRTKLVSIAEAIFRKDEQLKETDPLDGKYFFKNGVFSLPENFYISNKGLVFVYNPYEIKAYVYGNTSLTIPFSALKDIAKPNTVLTTNN